jgi:hypothetical protein
MKLTKHNIETIEKFAKHCIKELELKGKIKITLSKHQTGMPTAGYFDPVSCDVFVAVHNRAIADVMRTLSHELTHCRQKQQGVDFPHDDQSLQPLEDEANLMSGRLVRFWGRSHRGIYADLGSASLNEILFPDANNRKVI